MTEEKPKEKPEDGAQNTAAPSPSAQNVIPKASDDEFGGRRGPEPTRYGDWENGGKCVDF